MNSDKKKRLIIPVATLMVAIVMMAGVGYATIISSTFTVTENSTVGGEFSVTVVDYNNTNKLLKDVKIPYVVETLNGNPTNKVSANDYVLVENVAVKVTNNTGGAADCSISGRITAGSLKAEVKDAISFEFYNTDDTKVTSVNVGNGVPVTLTMKVVLKVTSDIPITNPSTELNSTDIRIEIVASKA